MRWDTRSLVFRHRPPKIMGIVFDRVFSIFLYPRCNGTRIRQVVIRITRSGRFRIQVHARRQILRYFRLRNDIRTCQFHHPPEKPIISCRTSFVAHRLTTCGRRSANFISNVSLREDKGRRYHHVKDRLFKIVRRHAISTPFIESFVVCMSVASNDRFKLTGRVFGRTPILRLHRASYDESYQCFVAQGFTRRLKRVLRFQAVFLQIPPLYHVQGVFVVIFSHVVGNVGRVLGVMGDCTMRPIHVVLYPTASHRRRWGIRYGG